MNQMVMSSAILTGFGCDGYKRWYLIVKPVLWLVDGLIFSIKLIILSVNKNFCKNQDAGKGSAWLRWLAIKEIFHIEISAMERELLLLPSPLIPFTHSFHRCLLLHLLLLSQINAFKPFTLSYITIHFLSNQKLQYCLHFFVFVSSLCSFTLRYIQKSCSLFPQSGWRGGGIKFFQRKGKGKVSERCATGKKKWYSSDLAWVRVQLIFNILLNSS